MEKDRDIIGAMESASQDLATVFEKMKSIPGMYDAFIDKNCGICRNIPRQIAGRVVKIAVVGAIKSGKTTFVNSLLQDDLLKRGAGLVTSVVTRVKRGNELKAQVLFKSWDEVNQEIEKALLFLPDMNMTPVDSSHEKDGKSRGFDLRRKSDRQFLRAAKLRIYSDFSITDSGIRPEAVLISNAVDGYDGVKGFVQADPFTVEFKGEQFAIHTQFTGIAANAFFVRDVLLEIPENPNWYGIPSQCREVSESEATADPQSYLPSKSDFGGESRLNSMIEIADCQGSDSTDPSHMIHIQDYLISANMLIYLISSRTGLREADLQFLKLIRKMGILNNILFIVNTDLSEHDTLEDLRSVEQSVIHGLGYFIDNPQIYTFSTLFNLFTDSRHPLASKNKRRLEQWQQEGELAQYCRDKSEAFGRDLNLLIKNSYHSIMLENHMERLKILAQGAKKRTEMFKGILSGDLDKASDSIGRLKTMQARSKQFESLMDDSIEKALENMRRESTAAIRHFFDLRQGGDALKIKRFILNYGIYDDKYEEMVSKSGFQHALYCMFQDFRAQLDLSMATVFYPALIEFIREQEKQLEAAFESLYQSYYLDPSQVYENHAGMRENNPSLHGNNGKNGADESYCHAGDLHGDVHGAGKPDSPFIDKVKISTPVDLTAAKRILGLKFPRISLVAGYSAGIKADAVARFSFYTVMEIFGKIFNVLARPAPSSALRESEKRIRKDILRAVNSYFTTYGDLLEKEYFSPLIQAVARDFQDKLAEMFQMCIVEGKEVEHLIMDTRSDKKEQLNHLETLGDDISKTVAQIDTLYINAHGLSIARG